MSENVQSDWNDSCIEAVRGSETVKEREGFAERTGKSLDTLPVLNAEC